MEGFSSGSNLSNKGTRPVVIISQLLQQVANFHHIDELLMWIANTMVHRLDIASIQVWAVQTSTTGVLRTKLRASASKHPSQTAQVLESSEVGTFVERMLRERRGMLSVPITNIFSQRQAAVFAQQNCFYWTTYFLYKKDVLLPISQKSAFKEETATPLQIIFSFFTQQPLQASQARAIGFLVDQSLRIAANNKLFSPSPEKSEATSEVVLSTLVPERVQMIEVEQSENPFSSAVILPERKVRQMYNLIDGKKNVADLAISTHTSQKEVLETLQVLVSQGHIIVCEPKGKPVEISSVG